MIAHSLASIAEAKVSDFGPEKAQNIDLCPPTVCLAVCPVSDVVKLSSADTRKSNL